MRAYLHGFGHFVPERIVTSEEIGARIGRSAEWIVNASGIHERRWAAPGVSAADMGVAAAEDCFRRTGVPRSSIGLVIVSSGSEAAGFPGPAAEIATRLGLGTAPALDVPVASAGSVFGLALAMRLAEAYGNVLLVATEKMSALIEAHPLDPNTAMLFGDGAAAALISSHMGLWRMDNAVLHSDGEYRGALAYSPGSGLTMNGLTVILQAGRKLPSVIEELLRRQGIAAGDVQAFLLHQANLNLLTRVGKALNVAQERIFTNVDRYGNTSSASMLLAASEWAAGDPPSGPIVFAAFGAGFHWGAVAATS